LKRGFWRALAVSLGVSGLLGAASLAPQLSRLDGLSVDALFWLRHSVFGPLYNREESRVAVIAIDEETYRRPPFKDIPKAMWTPDLARVMRAALDGGAIVIGQDVILPTSVEAYLPGFDRDYLVTLREGSRDGRIVLGQVQHSAKPISPFAGHVFAVGGLKNIRVVNLFRETDGIIRRIPVAVTRVSADTEKRQEATFSIELAARMMGAEPTFDSDGTLRIGDRRIHSGDAEGLLVNHPGGGRSIPVYSFADLVACADAGDIGFFEKAFSGRAVIVGAVLDVEDRKLTSARYVTAADGEWFADRCRLPVMDEVYDKGIVRETTPGAFVFAAATNSILRDELLIELPEAGVFLIATGAALLACLATLTLPLTSLVAVMAAGILTWITLAAFLFRNLIVVPLFDPILTTLVGSALMVGYRFAVVDRTRQQILEAFSYYLPSAELDRMTESDRMPELGGESREVTVFMSDIAGFTSACEGLTPAQIVRAMNQYFDAAGEIIEAHGGCICMYIGDAIVAVFGAPLDDPQHAEHAVESALAIRERLASLGPKLSLQQGRQLRVRTGIATGSALVGNIGSSRRFNYTVMGDTVNLAARLESANTYYGTDILISDTTASQLCRTFALRPIERVRVLGRETPVELYEPVGLRTQLAPGDIDELHRLEQVAQLRDRHMFIEARELLSELGDQPLEVLITGHLADWEREPPPAEELPVFDLPDK